MIHFSSQLWVAMEVENTLDCLKSIINYHERKWTVRKSGRPTLLIRGVSINRLPNILRVMRFVAHLYLESVALGKPIQATAASS
jgi:hypothetical protein